MMMCCCGMLLIWFMWYWWWFEWRWIGDRFDLMWQALKMRDREAIYGSLKTWGKSYIWLALVWIWFGKKQQNRMTIWFDVAWLLLLNRITLLLVLPRVTMNWRFFLVGLNETDALVVALLLIGSSFCNASVDSCWIEEEEFFLLQYSSCWFCHQSTQSINQLKSNYSVIEREGKQQYEDSLSDHVGKGAAIQRCDRLTQSDWVDIRSDRERWVSMLIMESLLTK